MILCDPKTPKNQEFRLSRRHVPRQGAQSGSAIVWVLVMVALFAALSYVVSSGFRAGESNLSKEKVDLIATEILDYAQSIKQAVQTLQINGCNETEISFQANNNSGNYNNTYSPVDKSCHVFDPNGGSLLYITPNPNGLDNDRSAEHLYGRYFFNGQTTIENLGDNLKDDLLIITSWLKEDVCKAINRKLFSETTIVLEPASFANISSFFGVFDYANSNINLSSNTKQNGATAACFESTNHGGYHFFHALIVR